MGLVVWRRFFSSPVPRPVIGIVRAKGEQYSTTGSNWYKYCNASEYLVRGPKKSYHTQYSEYYLLLYAIKYSMTYKANLRGLNENLGVA